MQFNYDNLQLPGIHSMQPHEAQLSLKRNVTIEEKRKGI